MTFWGWLGVAVVLFAIGGYLIFRVWDYAYKDWSE